MEDFGFSAFLFPQSFSIRWLLYSVAARLYFYIYIYTHMQWQATQHALKKRESARGQQPPPPFSLSAAVGFTLAVTLPSLFLFFQVAAPA
jgi:hypothetical protein